MRESEDKAKAVSKERRWATLAKKEAQGNAKAAKREANAKMPISAKESRKEVKIDMMWSNKRKRLANRIEGS